MSQMKLKSIGERLGSVENARVRFGDFFKFTNGLVFRFEAVIMGQYGILILIMSFILEFCYAGFQQATVLPQFLSIPTLPCTYSPNEHWRSFGARIICVRFLAANRD